MRREGDPAVRIDTQVLTEVIDNALAEPGRQLEVTEELARMLGIDGTVELEWRFATIRQLVE